MIKPMGTCGVATFSVIKDMERVALVPGLACAQIITFLVSNDFGAQHWDGIKSNIKKVLFIASMMMAIVVGYLTIFPKQVIQCFDRTGEFTVIAAQVFPLLSVLVFFDLLQLILSGALRGAGSVRTVMYARLLIVIVYFVPVSFIITHLPIENVVQRLALIYGSFYIGHILMSIIYINRFRGEEWKQVKKA
jgi:Na+-driven multidrug efflux pump